MLPAYLLRPELPEDSLGSEKLRRFDGETEYDLVFLGSSRIYRAFDPHVFDEELEARGCEVSSFNLGVGSMRPHEMNNMLDEVLKRRNSRLRFVVIELMDWSPTVLSGMETHDRTVHWHTTEEAWSAAETVWHSRQDLVARFEGLTNLATIWLRRQLNHGRGLVWVHEKRGVAPIDASGSGFIALDNETGAYYEQRRARFLRKYRDISLEQIRKIDAANKKPASLDRFNLDALLTQQARVKAAGLVPIYVLPNVRWGTPDLHLLEQHLENVLFFNDTKKYPELYREEHYFDRGHLNQKGAVIFSRLLAEELVETLRNNLQASGGRQPSGAGRASAKAAERMFDIGSNGPLPVLNLSSVGGVRSGGPTLTVRSGVRETCQRSTEC